MSSLTAFARSMIENRPAAHATHESAPLAPTTVEYRPVPQPVQSQRLSSAPVPNVPARHGRHCKGDRKCQVGQKHKWQGPPLPPWPGVD